MTPQAWFTLVVVFVTVVLLAREAIAPSVSVFGALVVLLVAGIITPAEAFAGFANPAPIAVAALYIVARAVEKTGLLNPVVDVGLGQGRGIRAPLARMLAISGGASAFLNNTPIVAMLVGPVTGWADRRGKSPSYFLMPLSFGVILGGLVTTIGTSTNLVISGLLEKSGHPPLALFEMSPVGLPVAVMGCALIVLLAPIVLPERRAPRAVLEEDIREFAVNMVVTLGGVLDGLRVEEGGLRHLQGVYLVQVERGGQVIAPVEPTTILVGGDRLTFVGRADNVVDIQGLRGLESEERTHVAAFDSERHTFFEAVIGAASPLVNKTLKESQFRARYQAAVIAIHRSGQRVHAKLGEVELHVGDTLILLTDMQFRERWRDRNDFLVVSQIGGSPPSASRKAWIAGTVTLFVAVIAGIGALPILQASLVGAFSLVIFRVLSPSEAKGAVDLDIILLIAASFGIGTAIERTGLAALLGSGLVSAFSWMGARGALLGVVLATIALTEVITHNAAAVIMFPIGMAAAASVGSDPRGYAVAMAIAASSSFLAPIGYQTNTMVYGPGGYKFSDYPRLGAPLTLLVIASVMLLVPRYWHL